MIKKRLFIITSCMVLAFSGCGNNSTDDENITYENSIETENSTETANGTEAENSAEADGNKITDIPEDSKEQKKDITEGLVYENIQQLFDGITDDMLNACEDYQSLRPYLESYWDDPLVLLNQFNKDARLYGLHVDEEETMLLYMKGEKILIEHSFHCPYGRRPDLNVCDIDNDGMDEVIISLMTLGGNVRQHALLVCDYEEKWNTYVYDDYLKDMEDELDYHYDEQNNAMTFWDKEGNVLWEGTLPEWTMEYPCEGVVTYKYDMGFSAETFQLDVLPEIQLKNSLPYKPIRIVFDLGFEDGDFKLARYEVEIYEDGISTWQKECF